MPRGRERDLPNDGMQIILNLSRDYLTDCGEDGSAHEKHLRGIVVGVRDSYQVVDCGHGGEGRSCDTTGWLYRIVPGAF
jgi:hypothetical protein